MRLRNLLLLPALAIAGCGGSDAGRGAASAPTAQPAAAHAGPRAVRISGFEFRPPRIEVTKGTKVTWRNRDAANHTVTFSKGPGDLGNVDEGKRLSARFTKAGRYAYVCQYHPNMRGTVVVR